MYFPRTWPAPAGATQEVHADLSLPLRFGLLTRAFETTLPLPQHNLAYGFTDITSADATGQRSRHDVLKMRGAFFECTEPSKPSSTVAFRMEQSREDKLPVHSPDHQGHWQRTSCGVGPPSKALKSSGHWRRRGPRFRHSDVTSRRSANVRRPRLCSQMCSFALAPPAVDSAAAPHPIVAAYTSAEKCCRHMPRCSQPPLSAKTAKSTWRVERIYDCPDCQRNIFTAVCKASRDLGCPTA